MDEMFDQRSIVEKVKSTIVDKNLGANILVICLSMSGLLCITGGAVVNKFDQKPKIKQAFKLKVYEKSTSSSAKSVESVQPKLKDVEAEVNMPISVDVKDYIENFDLLEDKDISKYKLDISLVNLSQAGTYTYTISYKSKKYNGKVTVKEKELPIINNMTLKPITIELGKELPSNITDYIVETVPEEAKQSIVIDLSQVNIHMAGTYQYSVTYKEKMYTGTVTVYEAQPQIIPPTNNSKTDSSTTTTDGGNNQANNSTPATDPSNILTQ